MVTHPDRTIGDVRLPSTGPAARHALADLQIGAGVGGRRPSVLQAGHVITIEPGLYYLGVGGVRIEDMALIRKRDSRCLTRVPKQLEI